MASMTAWRSSVTMAKPIRVFSSRSSKRSPAASLTQATLRRVESGLALGAVSGPAVPCPQVDVDLDDVGLPGGDRQHPPAPAADDEGRVGSLDRPGR